MNDKKQARISFYISLLFLLIILIISLYFYNNKTNNLINDELDVKFDTSDIINISNVLPVSDTLGKSFSKDSVSEDIQGYVEFSIKNKIKRSVKYQIIVTVQNDSYKKIKENYIKFYLTDSDNNALKGFDSNIIPSFYSLKSINGKKYSKLLYEGILVDGETNNFILRMWLSDSYGKTDIKENFIVDVDVRTV